MPYPTREQVYALFQNLSNPPSGTHEFFTHLSPSVKYTIPGHGRFAGVYTSRDAYFNGTWAKIRQALKPPGFTLVVTNGLDGVIAGQDGWAVVCLETRDTYTLSGVKYEQYYSWHCRFDEEGMIVEVRTYLDLGYLEEVVGTEMRKMGIE